METKVCKVCGQELPLESFMLTRGGGRTNTCRECREAARFDTIALKRAQMKGEQHPLFDPDFDGKDPGEVWRMMCRAEKWMTSRGYTINLSGEFREVKIRKLKKE